MQTIKSRAKLSVSWLVNQEQIYILPREAWLLQNWKTHLKDDNTCLNAKVAEGNIG